MSCWFCHQLLSEQDAGRKGNCIMLDIKVGQEANKGSGVEARGYRN